MKKFILALTILFICQLSYAKMHKEEILYKDGDTQLKGYLFWEDSFDGTRPGIMVIHEWWGLNDYSLLRAEMLAETGYVAFAADMYGNAKNTRHAADAKSWSKQISSNIDNLTRRAKLGLDILKKQESVDKEKLAAIGYCFGGAAVMQLAYTGIDIKAVASFHGSLPVATEEQAKKIKAKVLVAHGASDPMIPKERMVKFNEVLNNNDVDWEMNIYGGAKHAFTNPYADGYDLKAIAYNPTADRRSWMRLLGFFENIFNEED
ncbi:MAG: dienelactone hydrolase family protein [Gammaproteobacteria bacterium]|nr:dienelactone hydrolase family protein [Gammaproteobacteria bacterium]